MITPDLIQSLHCPYCGSGLVLDEKPAPVTASGGEGGIQWAVVACGCSRYPVVHGILVLEQGAMLPREHLERSVAALRTGDRAGALAWAARSSDLARRGPLVTAVTRLVKPVAPRLAERYGQRTDAAVLLDESLSFEDLALATRPTLFAHYLVQRFANPSLMGAAALIAAMGAWAAGLPRRPRVIDVGAGAGHASFLMQRLAPAVEVITSDADVISLCLARRILGSGATLIALDAQAPMPFADGELDGAFSLDAFHYIPSKAALVRELARVVKSADAGGVWVFPHLHNADGHNPTPGIPLTFEGYRNILAPAGPVFFDEAEVVRAAVREGRLPAPGGDLSRADALCMLGGAAAAWAPRDLPDPMEPPGPGPLGVNPVYAPAPGSGSGTLRFVRTWANDNLRRECAAAEAYLPETVEIDAEFLRRAGAGALEEADRADATRLLRSFILIPMPAGYRRAARSGL